MGYFQVRYDSRVVIYDRKPFIRLATVGVVSADGPIGQTQVKRETFKHYNSLFSNMRTKI